MDVPSRRRRPARLPDGGDAILAVLAVVVVGFSVLPMARLLLEGIAPGGTPDPGHALAVLSRTSTWRATWHSLETAVLGTAISLVLGATFALLVALTDVRGKRALVFCFLIPLMIPPQVTALAWIQLFGPSSAVLGALGLAPPIGTPNPLYGRDGIVLLLGIQHAPLVFLALRAGLRAMPREMVEAARASGARMPRVLLTVVLPLMTPALVAGGALAFVSAIGNFGIPAFLGIPAGYATLPTLVYQRLASFGPGMISDVAVLSVLVGALAMAGFLVQGLVSGGRDYRTIGAPGRALSFRLGRLRPVAEGGAWLVIALVLAAPLAALVATSLVPAYGVRLSADTATLANYAEVALRQDATARAFANSFLLAGGAALVLLALSAVLAYAIAWRPGPLSRALAVLVELPYALPGVVLAIAMILVFLRPLPLLDVSLYNTIWIIFVAYLARFLTLSLRPVVASYLQIDRSLEEAARMTGARFFHRLRTVLLPLVAPSAAAGAILVFMTAFNELTVSALLWSVGNETVGVVVFNLEESGATVLAAAVAVLTVVAIVAIMAATAAAERHLPRGVLPWSD